MAHSNIASVISRKSVHYFTCFFAVFIILSMINTGILLSRPKTGGYTEEAAKRAVTLGTPFDVEREIRTSRTATDEYMVNRERAATHVNIQSNNKQVEDAIVGLIRVKPNIIGQDEKNANARYEHEQDTTWNGDRADSIGNNRGDGTIHTVSANKVMRHEKAMEKLAPFTYLIPYHSRLFHVIDALTGDKRDKLMDMFDQLVLDLWDYYKTNTTFNRYRWDSWDDDEPKRVHEINCMNIHEINITKKLGAGYIKVAYEGEFHGRKVVVKWKNMKNNNFPGVCGWENFTCAVYRDVRILNELLLLDHMDHPMLIGVLGYCIHSGLASADFLIDPGVVGVYEHGEQADYDNVTDMNWRAKLNFAVDIADFMNYVEYSPFGRLTLYDLEVYQFVRIGGYIRLTDLDLVDNMPDPKCEAIGTQEVMTKLGRNETMCYFKNPFCLGIVFYIPCVNGVCVDVGQRHNMKKLYFGILARLLYWEIYPVKFQYEISLISTQAKSYLPAAVLHKSLTALRDKVMNMTLSGTGNV